MTSDDGTRLWLWALNHARQVLNPRGYLIYISAGPDTDRVELDLSPGDADDGLIEVWSVAAEMLNAWLGQNPGHRIIEDQNCRWVIA